MSGLKTIRRRIASVKNTKQITRAIKLVSAAKLRKVLDSVIYSREYLKGLERMVFDSAAFLPSSFVSDLLLTRKDAKDVKRVFVLAGDRGLCGSYNANLLKTVQREESITSSVEFVTIGKRASLYAKRVGWNLVDSVGGLSDDPRLWDLDSILSKLIKDFRDGDISEVVVYYTEFVSAMSQKVKREVFLPFVPSASLGFYGTGGCYARDVSSLERPVSANTYCRFHPNVVDVFSKSISMSVKAKFLQFILESKASEHAARMTAMDSATSNADDIIDKLKLHYNRARQSAITRELIDIVGGAQAVD